MAGTTERHLLRTGCCVLAAVSAWLGMSASPPPPPPASPAELAPAIAAEQSGLHQFVVTCALAGTASIPELQELAKSPDPALAGNAIRALGRLQAADDLPDIAGLLRDPRPRVRHEAIAALGQSGNQDAARWLQPLLYGGDGQARLLAIQSLVQLGADSELRRLAADPATEPGTRAFLRAATRPLGVPRLMSTTAGIQAR